MRTKQTVFGFCVAVLVGLCAVPASADLIYDWKNGGLFGGTNSNYAFTVADTFTVNQAGWAINALALYDSTKGTIGNNIYVALVDDTTGQTVVSAIDFKGVTDPTQAMYVTLALGSSVALIQGHTYSIEAWGFTGTNLLYVNSDGGSSGVSFNSFSGALTDYGSENCNGGTGTFIATDTSNPCYRDMHGMDFFGAGSLNMYKLPEPTSLALIGTGLVAAGFIRRRRKAAKS